MNKYAVIGILFVLILVVGGVYQAKFVPESEKGFSTGIEKNVSIVTFENTWRFEPEFLEVDQGDRIIMTVTNNDEYDHGFAIDAFGISQRMPAKETVLIDFVVTKAGDFPYYCSVSCGSGIVDGEERGHFDQVGKLHVRSAISETTDYEPEDGVDFAQQARESAMISPASEEATKLGFDTESLSVLYDVDNALWGIYKKVNDVSMELPENEYQAVLYRDDASKPVLWVFVDTSSGDVVNVLEVN